MTDPVPAMSPARALRRGLLWWLPPSTATFVYTVLLRPRPLRRLAHRLIERLIPEELDFAGVRLALNTKDAIVSGNLALGCYETFNLEFFQALLQRGMRVLDVGANIGVYSAIAARLVGAEGRVVAIEPSDANCTFIRRTSDLNRFGQLTVLQRGAAERSGQGTLFLNEENKADHRTFDADGKRTGVPVQLAALDDVVVELGIDRVDLLKVDVQGSELDVLLGMRRLLEQEAPLRLLMEFWPWGIARAGANPAVVLSILDEAKLIAFEIDGDARRVRRLVSTEPLLRRNRERDHADLFLVRRDDPILAAPGVRAFLD